MKRRDILKAGSGALALTGLASGAAVAQTAAPVPFSWSRAAVRSSSGIALTPQSSLRDCRGPIDTLVVAGGMGTRPLMRDEAFLGWVRAAAARDDGT